MAKKNVVKLVVLTPEQEKNIVKAISRTWDVIAADTLALTPGKPIKQADAVDMALDYVDSYGRLSKEDMVVFRNLPFEQMAILGKRALPYARYA